MSQTIKIALISLVLFGCSMSAFGAGIFLGGSGLLFEPGIVRAADQPTEFSTFWEAWNIVQQNFIDKKSLDNQQMTYGAIRGLIDSLGDEGHTVFLTPEQLTEQRTNISGKYSGIGAMLNMENGLPMIVSPFDGSPAAEAGVKAGDLILEVDGEDVTTWTLTEVIDHIRGEAGTEVTLTLHRSETNETLQVSIIRGEINAPTATWAMLPGTSVAMIRLSQFSANATEEIKAAVSEAKAAEATALIVDVRSNPGGLLEQAINVTSQFLPEGNVLQQEDADGNRQIYPAKAGGVATDIPLVVLINRGSASSSEIFAGAVQDYDRGQLVGETTFGTGTVLEPFVLNDGSGIMLGTSQWLTAKGRLIRKQGIEPDITVELPIGTDFIFPSNVEGLTVEELLNSDDQQVLKALELLNALPSQ